jgi:hypothetical protein
MHVKGARPNSSFVHRPAPEGHVLFCRLCFQTAARAPGVKDLFSREVTHECHGPLLLSNLFPPNEKNQPQSVE